MRRERSKTHKAATQPRPRGRIHDEAYDAYALRGKLPEPAGCPKCGALYQNGRWSWGSVPWEAQRIECPACRRTQDDYPDGILHLAGGFLGAHRDEILALAGHVEEREKREHPLVRIMAVRDVSDGIEISTTDRKLAKSIGTALHRAYEGKLESPRSSPSEVLRVRWQRD